MGRQFNFLTRSPVRVEQVGSLQEVGMLDRPVTEALGRSDELEGLGKDGLRLSQKSHLAELLHYK